MKTGKWTILVCKGDDGYFVGQLRENLSVVSQGKSIKELKFNLMDALKLISEYHKLKNYGFSNLNKAKIKYVSQ